MKKPVISIIAAISDNLAIGKNNEIPWHIPEDLKHFKETTTGHPIIMGRKTWESFGGKILPNRKHFIITRNLNLQTNTEFTRESELVICQSLDQAVHEASETDDNEIFIIGGGEIYKQSLEIANRLYLTKIKTEIEDATAFFPKDWADYFKKKESTKLISDPVLSGTINIYTK